MTKPERRTIFIGTIIVFLLFIFLFIFKGWGLRELQLAGYAMLYVIVMAVVLAVAIFLLSLKDKLFLRLVTKRTSNLSLKLNQSEEVIRLSFLWIVTPFMLVVTGIFIYILWSNYLSSVYISSFYIGFIISIILGLKFTQVLLRQTVPISVKPRSRLLLHIKPIFAIPIILVAAGLFGSFPFRRGVVYYLFSQLLISHPTIEALFMGILSGSLLSINMSYFFQALKGKGIFASNDGSRN